VLYDKTEFDQDRAERLIASLRVEIRQLKARLRDTPRLAEQALPETWQKTFADLRKENAKYRTQRNEARAELAALRAELV